MSEITLSVPECARVGETVKINLLDVAPGYVVDSLYYLDMDGKRFEIENGEFVMKEGGVSIGAEYRERKYTVTFVVDGKVISTVNAKYGDEVTPPTSPERMSDEKYSYTFVDWFPVVSKVTADVTYEARYMRTELPSKNDTGMHISASALKKIMKIVFLCFYLGVVLVPIAVLFVFKLSSRSRRRNKPDKENKTPSNSTRGDPEV